MLETTTATTTTTTAQLPLLPMQDSQSPQNHSKTTSPQESTDPPGSTMAQYLPEQCLFCPKLSQNFTESMVHMRKSHGLFIPHQEHLAVDLESLFRYLHLIIFGYRECIRCGTERATVQGVQQHMTGKGHCSFDTSQENSEFAEFYDFSEPEDDVKSDTEEDEEEINQEETATSSSRTPQPIGQDSVRLPSGKIISKQSSTPAGPKTTQLHRRARKHASRLERTMIEEAEDEKDKRKGASGQEEPEPGASDTRLLSKRERREKGTITYQMASMSANDRASLVHLPPSQQRAIMAAQFRHTVKVQKEERRRQGNVDRKGNKNLYAYWHTETPVYQCG
ncbi:hypothetical protein KVR01_006486 [Diaporthe batatas]|uniref:uncharacterized protein n=1 Tax=Diaporthe batatas TaxID=748121 RepID=UPI001D03A04A|nr:uncharacterized protein KVR01_006486 [Diaporthe batatas]KAG8164568.1 hypothetical protein KVR01_006486 [Diaporthe batatas]